MNIDRVFLDFYQFLKCPVLGQRNHHTINFSALVMLFFAIFFCSIFFTGILFTILGIESMDHKMNELFASTDFWKVFLIAVVGAPIMEEFIFRWFLKYPLAIFIFLNICIVAFVSIFIFGLSVDNILLGPILGLSVIIPVLIYRFTPKLFFAFDIIIKKHFGYIFYLSAVVFAFVHMFNFPQIDKFYYVPILVLPQFILGLLLAYIRLRKGMAYAILFHGINNLIPMTIVLIGKQYLDL